MSGLDEWTIDSMERQRRLVAALSSATPPSVADRLAALELKSAQDLDLIHRAIARIGALESSRADRYDEALADCLRALRQVLDGGKVECPFDADLVVALAEVARLRDENRTLESEAVAAEALAREVIRDLHYGSAIEQDLIAKARGRLAARAASPAPSKVDAAPTEDRVTITFTGFSPGTDAEPTLTYRGNELKPGDTVSVPVGELLVVPPMVTIPPDSGAHPDKVRMANNIAAAIRQRAGGRR